MKEKVLTACITVCVPSHPSAGVLGSALNRSESLKPAASASFSLKIMHMRAIHSRFGAWYVSDRNVSVGDVVISARIHPSAWVETGNEARGDECRQSEHVKINAPLFSS